jgi:hypothetical protein
MNMFAGFVLAGVVFFIEDENIGEVKRLDIFRYGKTLYQLIFVLTNIEYCRNGVNYLHPLRREILISTYQLQQFY